MSKVRNRSNPKQRIRLRRRRKIRAKVGGTGDRPRLSIYRSNSHFYAQLIDDLKGHTLASASTKDSELKGQKRNVQGAKKVGELIAKRGHAKSISQVVFDRSGYVYHGALKALADSAREAGLKF